MSSTDLVPFDTTQYPILAGDEEMREVFYENLGGEGFEASDFERISIPSGGGQNWELPDGDTAKSVQGIIVYHQLKRARWEGPFKGGTPPECSSEDSITGTGDPGGDCMSCPYAQFGSAEEGNGQACKQFRQLFVLPPNRSLPVVIHVPPTSLRAVKQYLVRLSGRNVRVRHCVTELGLESDKNSTGISFSKVTFKLVGQVPQEQRGDLDEYITSITPSLKAVLADWDNVDDG